MIVDCIVIIYALFSVVTLLFTYFIKECYVPYRLSVYKVYKQYLTTYSNLLELRKECYDVRSDKCFIKDKSNFDKYMLDLQAFRILSDYLLSEYSLFSKRQVWKIRKIKNKIDKLYIRDSVTSEI